MPMTAYKVRLNLWKMEGDTPQQVKKDVCEILRHMPEKFITVELLTDQRPLWKKLIFGP